MGKHFRSFCMSNGVKQGGIISSAYLMLIWMHLSCVLNRSNNEGRNGGEIHHLSFAEPQ